MAAAEQSIFCLAVALSFKSWIVNLWMCLFRLIKKNKNYVKQKLTLFRTERICMSHVPSKLSWCPMLDSLSIYPCASQASYKDLWCHIKESDFRTKLCCFRLLDPDIALTIIECLDSMIESNCGMIL